MDAHDKAKWNDSSVLTALREKLKSDLEFTVEIIFHINDDVERARQELIAECPALVALKRRFSKRFHILWDPVAKKQHYAVNDNGDVILDKHDHASNEEPVQDVVFNYPKLANEWIESFDQSEKSCVELQF